MGSLHAAAALLACSIGAVGSAQNAGGTGIALLGRIVSVTQEGLPAAEVWATDEHGKVLARTVADGDGVYQLRRLPDVPLVLHARAADRVESAMVIGTAGPIRAATLVLEDGAPLRGTVSRRDGTPVAGAAVVLQGTTPLGSVLDWHCEVAADATGAFAVAMAPLRPLRLRAWAPGTELGEVSMPRRDGAAVGIVLERGPAEPRRVRVAGATAGARVLAQCKLPGTRGSSVSFLPTALLQAAVAEDGTARLWPLPLPHEVSVVASGSSSQPVIIPCRKNDAADLDFVLTPLPNDLVAPRTRLSGSVVDALGQPLADLTVLVRCGQRRGEPGRTAADGSFALDAPVRTNVLCELGLAPGAWLLGDPRATLDADGVTWLSLPADPGTPCRLHAVRGSTIQGTARSVTGTPIGACPVLVQAEDAAGKPVRGVPVITSATDAGGRLRVPGLPPGIWRVTVQGDDGAGTATVELRGGETTTLAALSFPPVGEISGIARDAGGAPVAGALLGLSQQPLGRVRVAAQLAQRALTHGPRAFATDRNGRFRIRGVPAGEWFLHARGEAVQPGANTTLCTVAANEALTVDITVAR